MTTNQPDVTLEEALADPRRLYWALIAQGLKWVDSFAVSHDVPKARLEKILFEQFDVVSRTEGDQLVRRSHRRLPGGKTEVTEEIDLLARAVHIAGDSGDPIRVVFAYVRERLALAARAYRRQKRNDEDHPFSKALGHAELDLASRVAPPEYAAEVSEAIDLVRERVGDEDFQLMLERDGMNHSERDLARRFGMSRYQVHKRCERARDAAEAVFTR